MLRPLVCVASAAILCHAPAAADENNEAARIGRSDIVLARPNTQASEAMPLGNGRLGLAVWAADGLTVQLNRADTLPGRLSPGQVVLPGLSKITSAQDYAARLRLYDGEFTARGAGMSVTVQVEPERDVVAMAVSGADPRALQSVRLRLWAPRQPTRNFRDGVATLSESWTDSQAAGASGQRFGSLAAITVPGCAARYSQDDPHEVALTFHPKADGSFRVLVAVPHWPGGDAAKTAASLLGTAIRAGPDAHRAWWHAFWQQADALQLSSADGSAEYFENLRAIYLFTSAAENGDRLPGSQAGVADLFSAFRDEHRWDPAAYWHYNLRMQVAANLGAGLFRWNEPYFRLYRDNLAQIEAWTREHMRGLPGVCVPETMRFNGRGFENESWAKPALDCDASSPPYYNARTLSTGAEVSLWIWRQYLFTGDRAFLAANYPVMADSARFLLAYSQVDAHGKRHTAPSNAHENQWDVRDPTTDLAAMHALFPALIAAARSLGRDADLAAQAQAALRQIPEFPRTDAATLRRQLEPEADAAGQDAIGQSYQQSATVHNSENVGLEPVWPYGLIGDRGPLHDLAVRTYRSRPNKMQNDWSFDPIQAARLGLGEEVKTTLIGLTGKYQAYPAGFAHFFGSEFYVEQIGVVAAALQEALVQDYDGTLRIAPAWPRGWDARASIFVAGKSRVEVEMRGGMLGPVVFEAGSKGVLRVRSPWPGKTVAVTEGSHTVALRARDETLEFSVEAGRRYVLAPAGVHFASREPMPMSHGPRSLGERTIGLFAGVQGAARLGRVHPLPRGPALSAHGSDRVSRR